MNSGTLKNSELEVVSTIECLPCMNKTLDSIPSTTKMYLKMQHKE